MKLIKGLILLLVLFAAGCGNETAEKASNEKAADVETVEADQAEDIQSADLTKIKEAVPALASELKKRLEEVKWPTNLNDFYNRPISNATIGEDTFSVFLSLEDTTDRPLNLLISNEVGNYQEYAENGYTTQTDDKREYLVSPNKNEILFVEGDYFYQFNTISTLMNYSGDTLSLEELLAIAKEMSSESTYKDYFKPDLDVYKNPSYFTNDGKASYRLMVDYTGDGSYFDPTKQSLQISNDTAILEQAMIDSSYELFGGGEELTIDGLIGNLSYGFDGLFELPNGEYLFTLRLATEEVSEKTGTPSFVELPNWDEEITKIIKGLNLQPQQEEVVIKDTASSKLSEQQQREKNRRVNTIENVYIKSTLADSVFNEIALQMESVGPEMAVGYMQEQLFKRYIQVNKDIEMLGLKDIGYGELSSTANNKIQEVVGYKDPNTVFIVKDESKGDPTFYWLLEMNNSVEGYRVINIYDAEQEMFLSDF